ncbi:MAG: hypothetical protein RIR53_1438 [Bacteroidota bacterium]|jgi:outer membrane receptor for ferrienterochelin and colicin
MARRYILTIITLCLAATASWAGITGILAGKVTDKEGNPVAGAAIRVLGTTRGANSKLDGKFTVVNINAGSYDVRVTAVGYDTVTKRVTIVSDQTLTINFTLNAGGVTMKTVDVSAQREMVRPTDVGTSRVTKGSDMTKIARDNVASALSLSAGIRASGQGFTVRGGRQNETQILVDGLPVNDQFVGALGNVGSTISAALPSTFATEEVQAQTGGYGAEYGNAVSGVVNTVVKTGRTDRYEGLVRWSKDIPALFGKAGNGLQFGGFHQDIVDANISGPLGLGRSTFFIHVNNEFRLFRNPGLQVIDPIGNNWGQLPNNRTWKRTINGRLRFALSDESAVLVGTNWGMGVFELSSIAWLYATDEGARVDMRGQLIRDANGNIVTNGVPERLAKQPIIQDIQSQNFVQLNQTLGENTFFDVKVSYNTKTNEIGKRRSFTGPGLFSGIELYQSTDTLNVNDVGYIGSSSNQILDEYDVLRALGNTVDVEFDSEKRTQSFRNPITGYIEGTLDNQSTKNPFGLEGFFNAHGNTAPVELRRSPSVQVDGNITHTMEVGNSRHVLKGGFEFRTNDLSLYQNNAPWTGEQFSQSYGYENITTPINTKPARTPTTAAAFIQDQIILKGLVLTAGLRMDYVAPNAQTFDIGGQDSLAIDAAAKINLGPRISITYPASEDGRQNFQLSYGVYYQNPPFSNLFDGIYSNRVFENFFGNPDLQPQRTNQFQASYNHQLSDELAISITGYYNDIRNQPSIRVDTFQNEPKYQYALTSYGNSRGLEFTFMKRLSDNWSFNVNYTASTVRGNVQSATSLPPLDPATGALQFPIVDFLLGNDIPHRVNVIFGFQWGKDEGPTIAGIPIFENLAINASGFWQSGAPYTPVNIRGLQAGQINSARFPSFWQSELRIVRTIPLDGVFGGRTAIDLTLDMTNIFNYTEAITFYATTKNPDYDGNNLNFQFGNLTGQTYYREADVINKASVAVDQYDRYGMRKYQPLADRNRDGRVTAEERYQSYLDYVDLFVARRVNYQTPRTVFFAVAFRF